MYMPLLLSFRILNYMFDFLSKLSTSVSPLKVIPNSRPSIFYTATITHTAKLRTVTQRGLTNNFSYHMQFRGAVFSELSITLETFRNVPSSMTLG